MRNNIIKNILLSLVVSITFIACGGGGGSSSTAPTESNPTQDTTPQDNTTPNGETPNDNTSNEEPNLTPKVVSTTISGTVVDGPIYDANLSIYDMNGTYLGSTTTSSVDGKLGDYNITIENLPEKYIVKVIGGKDSGADGIINDNDEVSFALSSVGSKDANETHVSPATTLIATMVEDGVEVNQAKETIQIALGLPNDMDITTTSPKTNDIASRAGTFVASVVKSLPTDDKDTAMKSITKQFKQKADDNKSIATIDSASMSIDNLNLSAIANEIKSQNANAIKDEDIQKLDTTKDILNNQIEKTTQKIKAFDNFSDDEIKEALASHKTLLSITDEIDKIDNEELDTNSLENLTLKLEDGFNKVLEDGIDALSNDNIEILSDVIGNNLDKNISFMGADLKTIASQTKTIDSEIKTVLKKLYSSIDINESSKMQNLKTDDIKDLVSNIDENDTATKELLEESIASKLTTIVKSSTTTIQTNQITEVKTQTVDNTQLITQLKTIATTKQTLETKTTLTTSEKAELKAQELAIKNINKNLQDEDFTFDETAKDAITNLTSNLQTQMENIFNDDTKTQDDLFDDINSLSISVTIIKIDVAFDATNYQNTLSQIQTITSNIRTQKESNQEIDLKSSYDLIEKELESSIENNQTITDSVTNINNDVERYILEKEKEVVQIEPPYFPTISGLKMPELLSDNKEEIIK